MPSDNWKNADPWGKGTARADDLTKRITTGASSEFVDALLGAMAVLSDRLEWEIEGTNVRSVRLRGTDYGYGHCNLLDDLEVARLEAFLMLMSLVNAYECELAT